MHMDLTDLRLFMLVAEAGSITGGAARAGLALASASARVRGMEDQAGAALLDRGRRGVVPTAAGRALLHHARLVLAQMDRLRDEIGEYGSFRRGRVRMLANTAASAVHLPELLAGFLAAHPPIDIDLDERPSTEVTRAVSAGEAELGIAASHADLTGLQTLPFRTDRLVLACPPGHPLAARSRIAYLDALDSEFVGLSDDTPLGGHLLGRTARTGRRVHIRIRVRGLDAACRMVALGAGVAVLPEAAAGPWRDRGTIAMVPLDDPWATRQLLLVMPRRETLPPHAKLLADHLLR